MSSKTRKMLEDQLHKSFRVTKGDNTTYYSVCINFRRCEFEDKKNTQHSNQDVIKQGLVKAIMKDIENTITE